jgi:hypothetical protein
MRNALCILIIVSPSRSSPRNRAAQRKNPLRKRKENRLEERESEILNL